MPILDLDGGGAPPPDGLARQIADAAGAVLGSEPNGTWVRLCSPRPAEYAENGDAHPVLVSVIKAGLTTPDEPATEAAALASAIGSPAAPSGASNVIYEPPIGDAWCSAACRCSWHTCG